MVEPLIGQVHADAIIEAQARLRYADAIREWSQKSSGGFRDRATILSQAREELETVCRALDGWAAVDPDEVFGPVATNPFCAKSDAPGGRNRHFWPTPIIDRDPGRDVGSRCTRLAHSRTDLLTGDGTNRIPGLP